MRHVCVHGPRVRLLLLRLKLLEVLVLLESGDCLRIMRGLHRLRVGHRAILGLRQVYGGRRLLHVG